MPKLGQRIAADPVTTGMVASAAELNGHHANGEAAAAPRPITYAPLSRPEGRTDASNAARLVARYEEVVRWVGPWGKWLIWDGKRWKIDQALAIDLRAKEIAADLFVEIAEAIRGHKE